MRPRTVRPPVLYCRGMRPIQAAKSRHGVSGGKTSRDGQDKLLAEAKSGNTVIVSKLDRLMGFDFGLEYVGNWSRVL